QKRVPVANDVAAPDGGKIGKLDESAQDALAFESALLEHSCGRTMVDVTERIQTPDARLPGHLDHGVKRLGGVALPPRVFGEHITGCGPIERLEGEARA